MAHVIRCATAVVLSMLQACVCAQAAPRQRLDVVLVVPRVSERGDVLERWLRNAGMQVRRLADEDCERSAVRGADVVVVDWSPARWIEPRAHGPLDRWDRPTVFLGSSGARFASCWDLPTPAEMACMPEAERGPSMQPIVFAEREGAIVWRQGNLFHLPDTMPSTLRDEWRPFVVAAVRCATRFVSDRPIWRHGPRGIGSDADRERARRRRVTDAALTLRVAVDRRSTLTSLPHEHAGENRELARGLLADLLPEGPAGTVSERNWQNWFAARGEQLCWDPLSRAWRIDDLAGARGVASDELRGMDRADAGEPDAEAAAVAARIVQHYGGRALGDLATFSSWDKTMHYLWDRRQGYFRMENHHVPAGQMRTTPWLVSVIDTLADREVIWGSNGKGGPQVSARVSYRNLIERTFLPLMLLDPGIGVQLRKHESTAREAVLVVRLAGRGMDLRSEFVLFVERQSGEISRMQKWTGGKMISELVLEQTAPCGPLQLPVVWREQRGQRVRDHVVEAPAWNPDLPAGIATATEHLLPAREK